jgi:uncharacterized membrane protein YeiH
VTTVLASITGLDGTLEHVLDLGGIFVFAVSGASLAGRKGFDAVGIVVLAIATSLGGGMIRDVLIGDVPPAALREQSYLGLALAAALVVLVAHSFVERLARPVLVFDAAGVGLFCVVGAAKAMESGLRPASAVLLGTITAVGGGVIRDVLARDVPAVFQPGTALTAIPAAAGAAATVIAWEADVYGAVAAVAIAVAVFIVRLLAMRFGWQAPTARRPS